MGKSEAINTSQKFNALDYLNQRPHDTDNKPIDMNSRARLPGNCHQSQLRSSELSRVLRMTHTVPDEKIVTILIRDIQIGYE
jgi:hypothetical protein